MRKRKNKGIHKHPLTYSSEVPLSTSRVTPVWNTNHKIKSISLIPFFFFFMTYTVPLYVGRMLGQTEFNEPKRHRKRTFLAADKALKATFSSAPSVKEKPLRRTQSLGKKKKKKVKIVRVRTWQNKSSRVPTNLALKNSHTFHKRSRPFFFSYFNNQTRQITHL